MLRIRNNLFLLIILFLFVSNIILSCNLREGYVVTNDNKKIDGIIAMSNDGNGVLSTSFSPTSDFAMWAVDSNKKKVSLNLKVWDVKYFRVKEKKFKDTSTYVFFNPSFWRLLEKKDEFSIYKRLWEEDGVIGGGADNITTTDGIEDIALFLNNEQKFLIYRGLPEHKFGNNKWFAYFAILKFINKRYKQNFAKNYFKDEKAMLNYIIDRESETENKSTNHTS